MFNPVLVHELYLHIFFKKKIELLSPFSIFLRSILLDLLALAFLVKMYSDTGLVAGLCNAGNSFGTLPRCRCLLLLVKTAWILW
jgi:hypothetical protein